MEPGPKIDPIFFTIAHNMMQHIKTENIDLRTIIYEAFVLCLSRSTKSLSIESSGGYNDLIGYEMLTDAMTVSLELVLPYSDFGNEKTLTKKVPDKREDNTDDTADIILTRFSGLEFDD